MSYEGLYEWFVHIPQYIAGFADWLNSPIAPDLGWTWTPLQALGVSVGAFFAIILTAHLVHLIIG